MTGGLLSRQLAAAAAERYRAAGRFAYHFARGKLNADPVFALLLSHGLIPAGAHILDLGCGQGLLAAWLTAAGASHERNEWCESWPAPPLGWSFRGIERAPNDTARAALALGTLAQWQTADIRTAELGRADAIVILDVLHYMNAADQAALLRRVRTALMPGGVLLLRIGHAGAGWPFRVSQWVDRAVLLLRGQGWSRLYCRTLQGWVQLLSTLGFQADPLSMGAHAGHANVLLIARST